MTKTANLPSRASMPCRRTASDRQAARMRLAGGEIQRAIATSYHISYSTISRSGG